MSIQGKAETAKKTEGNSRTFLSLINEGKSLIAGLKTIYSLVLSFITSILHLDIFTDPTDIVQI